MEFSIFGKRRSVEIASSGILGKKVYVSQLKLAKGNLVVHKHHRYKRRQ
jgi:tRNA U34 2-thiouridine synthase MnmA/TrmU